MYIKKENVNKGYDMNFNLLVEVQNIWESSFLAQILGGSAKKVGPTGNPALADPIGPLIPKEEEMLTKFERTHC